MDRKKITKKELIISVSFLAIFIISSILISYTPSSIEITYGLTTTTEDNVIVYYNTFEPKNNDGNMKAIIIGHGGMATKEFMKGFAVEIANAGFFVIAFDFRGHGQSSGELDFTQLDYEVTAIKDVLGERGDIDMTNLGYIGYSMGGSPGVRAVHNDTAFKCFIGMGTGIPYSDYLSDYLVPSNLTTRSLNVLSIQARFDEAITMDQLLEGMSARIGISKASIEVNKLYGSFENGNASMIYLDDNSDHLLLTWDETFIRVARDWVINTFPEVTAPDENFYRNIIVIIFYLQIIGGIGFFFSIVGILARILKIEVNNDEERFKIEIKDESVRSLVFKVLFYSAVCAIPGLIISVPVVLLLPLTIAGIMVVFLFGQAFAFMIFLWRMHAQQKHEYSLKQLIKLPFEGDRNHILRQVALGFILSIILYMVLYLSFGLNILGMVPGLSKLPWVPLYFLIFTFILIIFYIIFNMMFQPKLGNDTIGLIKTGLIGFGVNISYMTTLIVIPCLIMNNYFIVIFLYIVWPVSLLVAFVSTITYKITGNILTGAIVSAVVITGISCTVAPYLFILTSGVTSNVSDILGFGLI